MFKVVHWSVVLAVVAAAVIAGIVRASLAAYPVPAASSVAEVTVYRGQALVTRTVALPEGAGELELAVGDLPEQVVANSIAASAEGAAGVAIRSVRFRARAVAETPQKMKAAK